MKRCYIGHNDGIWYITLTQEQKYLTGPFDSLGELIEYCNRHKLKVINKHALIDKYSKQLKY